METAPGMCHIPGMTARDRFPANLKCPQCGREGIARLSEEDGYSYAFGSQDTKVDHLPEGFLVVEQKSPVGSVDLFCAGCNVSAVAK
ncbi:MAG: hypothetical protein WDN46_16585 [Methylocella sp.]